MLEDRVDNLIEVPGYCALVALAKAQEEVALSCVAICCVLAADRAELNACAIAHAGAGATEVLGGVAAELLGGSEIGAHLVEAVHMLAEDGHAELPRHLHEAPGSSHLSDVVPADRVGAAEGEVVVRGHVTHAAAAASVRDRHHGGAGRVRLGAPKLNEAGEGRKMLVEEGRSRADSEALVHLCNSSRAEDQWAITQRGIIPLQSIEKRHEEVSVHTVGGGRMLPG